MLCSPCEPEPKKKYVYKCIHNKTKYRCGDCGGASICTHKKQKRYCRQCEGSGLCLHDRQKHVCKECGTGYCSHGKKKSDCIQCKGSSICVHLKRRRYCKDCSGKGICEHKRNIEYCRQCNGSAICQHDKLKRYCKTCGGSAYCQHGKQKQVCKECDGNGLCSHGRQKLTCTECPIKGKIPSTICKGCMSKQLNAKRIALGLCATCEKQRPERTEVTFGKMIIDEVGFEPNSKDTAIPFTNDCKGFDRRRPDLLWVVPGSVAVIVEIDEHSHKDYEPSCEVRKISEQNLLVQQLQGCENIPVFTIRVNPDTFDKKRIQKLTRAKTVARKVKDLLDGTYDRNGYAKVFFHCYHSKSQHLIDEHAKNWDCEVI